jgi:hypothetical protein
VRLQDFVEHVKQAHIASFATPKGGAPPPHRFLFHARRAPDGGSQPGTGTATAPGRVLAQVSVDPAATPAAASVVVRSDDAAAAAHVAELLQNLLLSL